MADLLEIARAAKANPPERDYTPADLEEMDRLLRELAQMEGWLSTELDNKLDQRRRMAPARVPEVLGALRAAHKALLAIWPEKPSKRSEIAMCVLTVIPGGRSQTNSPNGR